ncbi:MAG: AAA family ATPase, partial [Myxococcales bacterium]|nr:AAA family ATPase [Myxococcales bacterium]
MGSGSPDVVYEGRRTRVLRVREPDGASVIVKQTRSPWPTAHEIQRLRREHDLLALIDGQGAPRPIGFSTTPTLALRIEDLGGESLDHQLASLRASPRRALEVALGLARALAEVHARGVVHRDLNPSNAIAHPESGRVWLIDFDFAAEATALEALGAGREAQGTPPYMAPEQTGRLHRPVDARSDLYALGVTLYELLGGHRPFEGRDLLEYTHAHLALAPPTLVPAVAGLPAGVVPLVMTLLRKSPDDRYQSAEGVARDLAALLDAFDAGTEAELQSRHLGRRAVIDQDVTGRSGELARLERAFARAAAGGRAVALVHGPPGIGKTSVVRELVRPVALAGGRLLSGKLDQFARDVPLSGLSQALDELAAEILSAPSAVMEQQRDRVIAAVGASAPLLAELSEPWRPLVGERPAPPELGPVEAERRLQDTLRNAFGATASADHPLVLFLDDLQWADLSSLRVLEALFRDPSLGHLLLVLSWREAAVGPDHALHHTVAALREAGAEVTEIALGPLSLDDVVGLVARALDRPSETVTSVAEALHEKTGGNPFFLRRLFDEAVVSGAFEHLDDDDATLAAIRALPATENVIELLQAELGRLDEGARALLSAAALLGETFDRRTLEHAVAGSADELSERLRSAVRDRFLRPLDPEYWSAGVGADGERFRFAFVHDRVQQ